MKSKRPRNEIPVDLLRELVAYDEESGKLRWLPRRPEHFFGRGVVRTNENLANNFNSRFANATVGSVMKDGYLSTKIFGKSYLCHRIAFALVTGSWPQDEIDHINGKTADNSWENLRPVVHSENGKNQRREGAKTSGVVGVDYHRKYGKWRARITVDGKVNTIGSFDTLSEAVNARKAAERKYGFHPNHGRMAA